MNTLSTLSPGLMYTPMSELGRYADEIADKILTVSRKLITILSTNHPKSLALYKFITLSDENMEWYYKNLNNIQLLDGKIYIMGDLLFLDDEKILDFSSSDFLKSIFTIKEAIEYTSQNRKSLPNWSKYMDSLPGEIENKLFFLREVIGLGYFNYVSNTSSLNYLSGNLGTYLNFSNSGISICGVVSDTDKFSLRCVETRQQN